MYIARETPRADRIREDNGVLGLPEVDRFAGVVELEHGHVEALGRHLAGNLDARGIVAAVRVTNTDNECLQRYRSSTVRSRKCVAHEMQGS